MMKKRVLSLLLSFAIVLSAAASSIASAQEIESNPSESSSFQTELEGRYQDPDREMCIRDSRCSDRQQRGHRHIGTRHIRDRVDEHRTMGCGLDRRRAYNVRPHHAVFRLYG